MSALYQPTDVAGQEYTRCYQVVIDNHRLRAPVATFFEERVLVGSTSRAQAVGQVEMPYDPASQIALVDPTTGEPTGQTISGAQLYAMVYSAYMHAAVARDAAGAEEDPA